MSDEYSSLTDEQLAQRITEVKDRLTRLDRDIEDHENSVLQWAADAESAYTDWKRIRDLGKPYETLIGDVDAELSSIDKDLEKRRQDILRIEEAIARWEVRLKTARAVEAAIIRGTLATLKRSLRAYRGWQTQQSNRRSEYVATREDAERQLDEIRERGDRAFRDYAYADGQRQQHQEVLNRLYAEKARRQQELRDLEEEEKRKAKRVQIRLYIIIDEGEHTYTRTYLSKKGEYSRSQVRRYPSGTFQAIYELDAKTDPQTADIQKTEPFVSGLVKCKKDFVKELRNLFFVSYDEEDVDEGESSLASNQKEVGQPPKRIRIGRVVAGTFADTDNIHPKTSWEKSLDKWVKE